MIFSRYLDERSADVMGDAADLHVLGATTLEPPFRLFDWYLKPHLYSPDFPERGDAWADRIAARADFAVYLIDDETAIRVDGNEMDVISVGRGGFTLSSLTRSGPGRTPSPPSRRSPPGFDAINYIKLQELRCPS